MERKRQATGLGESSRSCEEHKAWLAVWGAELPSKVKVHVWRLIENGLAVGKELKYRKIKDNVVCLVCNREESLFHRFWSCPHSIAAWKTLGEITGVSFDMPPRETETHDALKSWILKWIVSKDTDLVSWFMQMIYNLWSARNDARDSKRIEDPCAVARKTTAPVEEWLNLREAQPEPMAKPVERWLKPAA